MDSKIIHILLVEDDAGHTRLISKAFESQAKWVNLTIARSLEQARNHLATHIPDLVITDLRLPDGQGIELLPTTKKTAEVFKTSAVWDTGREEFSYPVVMMTSYGDEQVAVEAMKAGALDYVVKSRASLATMPYIAERALREWDHITERKRADKIIEQLHRRNKLILNAAGEGILGLDLQGKHTVVNPAAANMLGYTIEELIGQPSHGIWHHSKLNGKSYPEDECPICVACKKGIIHRDDDEMFWRKDGTSFPVEYVSTPIQEDGSVVGTVMVFTDITKHRRVEEALQHSLNYLDRILNGMHEGVMVVDCDYNILDVNARFLEQYGQAREQIIGRTCYEVTHWKSEPCHQLGYPCPLKSILETGEPVRVEHIHKDHAGNDSVFELHAFPLFGPTGEIESIVEISNDITERKQAEEEIRRRNRELTLLNQITVAAATETEPEAVLETACRELALAFEVSRVTTSLLNEEKTEAVVVAKYLAKNQPSALSQTILIEGNPLFQYLFSHKTPLVVDNAQNDPRLASMHDLMRQRGIVSLLILPLIVDGEIAGSLDMEANKPRHFLAEEVSLAWSVADQVAGALARISLAQTHRHLVTVIEQATENVIITDTKGVILYVNPAFERITGYSRAETVGQNPRILKSGKQSDLFYKELWATIKAGQAWHGRFSNKKKDGALYTADATITPVRGENGAIVNYVAVQRDVTHELELEEQYRQAQKMEAVGQLAGGIAHDFNNILTTIIGHSEFLLQQYPNPQDPARQEVEQIKDAGERAAALTRRLLAFSRQQSFQPQVLHLNDKVTGLERMLRRLIGENIELIVNLAPDLGRVKVDSGQIEQVLMNLVINARDAMPRGGQLTIETANVDLDETYAGQHLDVTSGPYAMLVVTDTGTGIDSDIQPRIFEPFFTTKGSVKGTGLGLSTVYGIVRQNGGHIRVYSKPEQGTTFKIYLPSTEEPLETTASLPVSTASLDGTEVILLVEDSANVRLITNKFLRKRGYTVLEASHAEEAMQIYQRYNGQIDLLIADVIMPDTSGPELVERLAESYPNLKVLYISGYTDDILDQHGASLSNFNILEKPFSSEVLARKVREVLGHISGNSLPNSH